MSLSSWVGYIAGTCTTVASVPQIIRAMRTKSTTDISYASLGLQSGGSSLWIVYGASLHNGPIIVFNVITCALVTSLVVFKFVNERKQKPVAIAAYEMSASV